MASLDQTFAQAKDYWGNLGSKQRWLLVGGATVCLTVLAIFISLMSKPELKPLYTGMEPGDAQALATKLAADKVPYEISADGKSVSVAADKLDAVRLSIASQGMPRSGRLGFELFDKMNWGQTDFDEKVNYQRALEGELERTIQSLRDVESSRVHLVMPTSSVFLDRDTPAKASVILKLRSGRLSDEAQVAIRRLVAGAVDKLDMDNVTVVDADTNRSLGSPKQSLAAADTEMEKVLTARLLATLEPLVGPQRVRASVNVEFDSATTEENQESYDPDSVVALATQSTVEQNGEAAGTTGVPGTASNIPKEKNSSGQSSPASSEDGPESSMKTENSTYVVNKVVRRTVQPAGRVRRISAAVVVDDAVAVEQLKGQRITQRRKRTPEEISQIEAVAKAVIGLDSSRGDTIVVQNLSFEVPELPGEEGGSHTPKAIERVRRLLNEWPGVLRYGSLIILFLLTYFLLLRPLTKRMVPASSKLPEVSAAALQAPLTSMADELPLTGSAASLELSDLPEDRQRVALLRKQLVERVKKEPAATSRLVQAWLRDG